MRAATVVQQLCKSCRTCFMFYCMFYFTCDRSLSPVLNQSLPKICTRFNAHRSIAIWRSRRDHDDVLGGWSVVKLARRWPCVAKSDRPNDLVNRGELQDHCQQETLTDTSIIHKSQISRTSLHAYKTQPTACLQCNSTKSVTQQSIFHNVIGLIVFGFWDL